MARHLLDRPFDQERFIELRQAAQTALNVLAVFTGKPGQIHDRNGLYTKLRHRIETLEKYGENYYQFESSYFDGKKVYYTLDSLEEYIERVNKFLGYT